MKNKNLLLRTLTCVVGIPLLALIVFVFPQNNFLAFRILVLACSVLGSIEISKLVFNKIEILPVASCILPFICLTSEINDLGYYLSILIILAFGFEIKNGEKDNFEGSITRIGKNLISIIYPSFLLTFLMKLATLEITNSFVICYFFVLVFANDIFAYIMGTIFGEKNNAHLKASPKKSWAGFIGGIFWTLCFSLVFTFLFEDKVSFFKDMLFRILTPIAVSVFADIGDLSESVLKRSAKVKDSSNLIPGHGGILDRLDSIVAVAPIFYFIVKEAI